MFPLICCVNCGRELGSLYQLFLFARVTIMSRVRDKLEETPMGAVLDQLGVTKECCRTGLVTNQLKNAYIGDM